MLSRGICCIGIVLSLTAYCFSFTEATERPTIIGSCEPSSEGYISETNPEFLQVIETWANSTKPIEEGNWFAQFEGYTFMTIQDELIRRCVATQRWRSSWRGNPEEEVPDLNRSSADARLVFVVWWGSLLAQVHDRAASWMKSKQTRVAFFVIGNDRGDRIIFECHAFDDPQRYGLATTVTVILYFVENRTGELITIAQQTLEPSSQIPHFSRETWEQVCAASRIFLEGNGPKRKVNKEEKTVSVANPIGEQSDPLPKSKEFPPGVYRITRETRLLHDPRPDAEVVTQLTAGRRVRVVGSVEGAWLKVESSHADRPPGYVRAEDVGAIQENSGRTK